MKMIKRTLLGALTIMAYALALMFAFSGPATALPLSMDADPVLSLAFGGILVNASSINAIFVGLKTIFNNALVAQPGNWQETAMEIPSSGASEDYAWLTRFPAMRKWVGEKFVKSLEAKNYTKVNEDWETTIAVNRNDIDDDRLGIYNIQAQSAGSSAAELNDIIVDELKNNAFVNTGLDGQYFYDTDHEVKGASVSNKLTVVLSSSTPAAVDASYGAARTAIMEFTDDEGMPLRLIPDTLEVPPALFSVANKLLTSDKLDDNSPNPYKGTAKLLVNPALTSRTTWFLHVTTKPIKPFIVQMRKKPTFVSQTSPENDDVFMKKEFKFGAEARATGVYGFWQLSVGSTGAG